MKDLTIGQLAASAHVTVETVRYYERRGLVPKPRRTGSGYRQYSLGIAGRIYLIKRAQALGFSLKEIAELISLQAGADTSCADIRKRAVDKLADIEGKMRDLQRMERALMELVTACPRRGPPSECPILEALATQADR